VTPDRPTFSPLWHRIRALKPRLRPHVQITRQHYRGRRWHVVHDPASNQFYRLGPVAHEMVGLLDGQRTVEEVWNISLSTHGDGAPTQGEVMELLGQMYNSNLLAIDTTPETEQLLSRGRERTKRRIASQALGIMYFRLRLFNPDRFLTWLEPLLRPLINRWGFLLWLIWIVYSFSRLVPHWDELREGFKDAVAPSQWLGVFVVFIAIKAIHETGHGVICKRFGGQVPEFGTMLLVLLPSPYVDASATWAFANKWQRIAVGAGGMIFELAVAGVAAHVWLATLHGGSVVAHKLAFNALFTASVTTVLFNANPLMRFDGYYILSDLLEVPNLMQRSTRMLQYLCQRYIYRIEQARPPSTSRSELWTLFIYGVLAMAYRVILFFSITLYMMGKMFAIGLVLAVWTAAAWFIIPVGKFIHWLTTSPQIDDSRPRAFLASAAILLLAAVGVGWIPVPEHQRAAGIVESEVRTGVYFVADGFVKEAHVHAGDHVRKGDPIVTCESEDLRTRLASARAQLLEFQSLERQYTGSAPAYAQIARDRASATEQLIRDLTDRQEGLIVRAPHDGVIVPGLRGVDPQTVGGAYVKRGQILCEVVDADHLRVAAPLSTLQAEPLLLEPPEKRPVQIRSICEPDAVLEGSGVRIVEAGQQRLPHPALGYTGGGTIETDPKDKNGLTTKASQFIVYVDAAGLAAPGERVTLRFTLPSRPLLDRWIDKLRQLLQGRVNI
jgi:putative peptide zinc metalloprotease protein